MSEHEIARLKSLESARDGSGHSIYGASGSWIYLNCAGSLIPNILAPDDAGEDAAYGTVAHFVSETWRKTGKRPDHLLGEVHKVRNGDHEYEIEIDDEMLEYARMVVDETDLIPGTHYIEQHVDFSRITPIANQGGRADFIAIDFDAGLMVVADDKFGRGHRVYAKENPQAMLYALGALWKFDPEGRINRILIKILQPRIDHFDEWEVSREDLLMFAGYAKYRMALAWKLDAPRRAGEHCLFCRVKATCAARAKLDVELTEGLFDDLDAEVSPDEMAAFKERLDDELEPFEIRQSDAATLTTAQMAKLFPFRKASDKWWKALSLELMQRAISGGAPGLKVVESRASRRAWKDEDEVVSTFAQRGIARDALYEAKLKSPAQAEKLLRAKGIRPKDFGEIMEPLTRKPPGKPTLAPISDARQAIEDVSTLFEAIDDDDDEI